MTRPSNGSQVEFMKRTVGLLLPFYGTDDELGPGWVISDGTIQNGYQTTAYTPGVTPMQFSTNSNNIWGGEVYEAVVNRPGTNFSLSSEGSEHEHVFTGTTDTRVDTSELQHKHLGSNITSSIADHRAIRNSTTVGRTTPGSSNIRGRTMYNTDLSKEIIGEITTGGEHKHGMFTNDDTFNTANENTSQGDHTYHIHSLESEYDVTKCASFMVRIIVYVGMT